MANFFVFTHLPGPTDWLGIFHTHFQVNYWDELSGTTSDFNYSCLQLHSETLWPFRTCHGNSRTDGTRDRPAVDNETLMDANHCKTQQKMMGQGWMYTILFSRTWWAKSQKFLSGASVVVMYLIVSKFETSNVFFMDSNTSSDKSFVWFPHSI